MIALTCIEPGKLMFLEKKYPLHKKGFAILKVRRIGICGTDYHAFSGNQPFFEYPRVLGHEIAAEIVAIEENSLFKIGDYVAVYPYFSCGKCIACRSGKNNCCESISVFGVHEDGGMQEYISVPQSSLVLGNGLSLDELSLVEPLAIGAHGVSLSQITQGEYVLVIGAGPIGLGAAKLAQLSGGNVIVMDLNDARLNFCKEKLAIQETINPSNEDVQQRLMEITNGDMPTVIIECSGNVNAINGAVPLLAHGGRLILIGLQKKDIIISHPEFHKRETTMRSSRNASHEDFRSVITYIQKGILKPADFITHKLSFIDVPQTFDVLLTSQSEVIKAVINFDQID
ncbi:zinc-binding alcohol dehydrogenase family protein [Pedobacter sp. BMA]|uniref:zinc-binding alcohol dehydrogenase family protein n=1 Tax=Pedobacter sp. BMA TaxID=1663685 RepID=UPI00064A0870|nr:zinc-binding alcohol dehydrogenase family protein [Pedobacter sp. BMA]KLT67058.1 alcohol dehydrogenase [Pedobacter sp. BMA]